MLPFGGQVQRKLKLLPVRQGNSANIEVLHPGEKAQGLHSNKNWTSKQQVRMRGLYDKRSQRTRTGNLFYGPSDACASLNCNLTRLQHRRGEASIIVGRMLDAAEACHNPG